jgi:4-amino-4-deoxy-L-arabinose transferase-like glycosyltransferase
MRTELWVLAAITVLAAALRFAGISSQSIWLDEWLTHNYTVMSLHDMASTLLRSEPHPPLYFGLEWGWSKVFGTDEFGLRSLSALVGTITVPLAYAAARTRLSPLAALLAAAFVAVNPFSVWFSQEARPYALLEALCLVSLICLIRAVDGGSRRWLWGWAAASALALTTHFFAGFLIAGEVVWLLWHQRNRRVLAPLAAVGVVGVLMLALVAGGRASEVAWVHASAPLETRVSMLPVQFLTGLYLNWDAATDTAVRFVCAAVLCAIGLVLALVASRERRRTSPFLVAAGAVLLLPLVLALVKPSSDYVLPRYLIAAVVPLLILVAIGFASRRAGLVGAVGLIAVLLSMTISISARSELQRPDWRGVSEAIGPASQERAVVTNLNVQARPLTYYAKGLSKVYDGGSPVFAGDPLAKGRAAVTVSEVVYVTPAPLGARLGRTPPAQGFSVTSRRNVGGFLVVGYKAKKPRRFTAGGLASGASRVYGFPLAGIYAPAVYLQRSD